MSKRTNVVTGLLALALGLLAPGGSIAHALSGPHHFPNGIVTILHQDWPQGIVEALNAIPVGSGGFINANDWFHYSGSASELNLLLKAAQDIENTDVVVHLMDPAELGRNLPNGGFRVWSLNSAWMSLGNPEMKSASPYVVQVEVPVGPDFRLLQLRIPREFEVKALSSDVSTRLYAWWHGVHPAWIVAGALGFGLGLGFLGVFAWRRARRKLAKPV